MSSTKPTTAQETQPTQNGQSNPFESNTDLPDLSNLSMIAGDGFIRLPKVLLLIPISRSAWYAGIKAKIYPPGVKLSPRTTAWKLSDIQKLIKTFK